MLRRLFTSASRPLLKDFVSKVPGMGDSITEGSLIKLVAKVGALVKQDEIVAVIETDKVRDSLPPLGIPPYLCTRALQPFSFSPTAPPPSPPPPPPAHAGERGCAQPSPWPTQGLPRRTE